MAHKSSSKKPPVKQSRADDCTPRPRGGEVRLPVLPSDAPKVRPSRAGKWRAYALMSVHVLMIAHFFQWMIAGETISPVEPSESMETITSGAINAGFIFFAVALLATLFLGRWVCGWGCHLIAYQDLTFWVLKKLKLRPKAFSTRLFWLVPLTAAGYMFVWPELVRLWVGVHRPHTTWHVMTTGFWDTFPQYGIAILTVLVCGVAMIHFLGPKGFCTFACPYGAFFGLTDKLAVGRIRVTDDCHECGHCTSVCSSNVRVAEEVKLYKMVVDPSCMKCMDCVTVCPNDALYFGFGAPSLGRRPVEPRPKRRFDLGWGEEIFALLIFAGVFLAFRGLYGKVPFLMSLGIAGVVTYLVMKIMHMAFKPDVLIQRTKLKVGGTIQPAGKLYAAGVFALLVFTVHSGIWRYHDWMGGLAFAASPSETFRWQYGSNLRTSFSDAANDKVAAGIRHLEFSDQWGIYPSHENDLERVWLYICKDRRGEAAACLKRVIDQNPHDFSMQMHLGRILTADGDLAGARKAYERAIEIEKAQRAAWTKKLAGRPMEGTARLWAEWGMFLEHCGEADEALEALQFACEYDPRLVDAWLALGSFQLRMDNIDDARSAFISAACIAPGNFDARSRLDAVAKVQQHFDQAVAEYRAAIKNHPSLIQLRQNLGFALTEVEQFQEAAEVYREALKIQPDALTTRADYGAVLLILGDRDGAIEQYRLITGAEPTNAEAAIRLAYLYIQMGDVAAARPLIESALKNGDEMQKNTARMFMQELGQRTGLPTSQP